MTEDDLLTTAECAELLRLNDVVLHRWRAEGRGPAYCRVGKKVLYRRAAVIAYIRSLERPAGGEVPA